MGDGYFWVNFFKYKLIEYFDEFIRNGESNFLIGIRDFIPEYQNIIAMDYSRQIGFRPFTRRIIRLKL